MSQIIQATSDFSGDERGDDDSGSEECLPLSPSKSSPAGGNDTVMISSDDDEIEEEEPSQQPQKWTENVCDRLIEWDPRIYPANEECSADSAATSSLPVIRYIAPTSVGSMNDSDEIFLDSALLQHLKEDMLKEPYQLGSNVFWMNYIKIVQQDGVEIVLKNVGCPTTAGTKTLDFLIRHPVYDQHWHYSVFSMHKQRSYKFVDNQHRPVWQFFSSLQKGDRLFLINAGEITGN